MEVCRIAGWRYEVFWYSSLCGDSLPAFVAQHPSTDIMIVHDVRAEQVMELGQVQGVHVIRDPRDVVISALRSHKGSHWFPEGRPEWHHQQRLREVSEEEGLALEIENAHRYLDPIKKWFETVEQPGVMDIAFEEITRHPYEGILQILTAAERLDESRSTARFIATSFHAVLNRLGSKVGLRWPMRAVPGGQALAAAYRMRYRRNAHHQGGVVGQWRGTLRDDNLALYTEAHGGLAEQMGYAP